MDTRTITDSRGKDCVVVVRRDVNPKYFIAFEIQSVGVEYPLISRHTVDETWCAVEEWLKKNGTSLREV